MDPNLHMAAVNGNIRPFKRRWRNLEEIVHDQNLDTILHVHFKFSRTPSLEFVKVVLELCPSLLRQVNDEGDTPLHVAAEYGHSAVMEFLLQREKNHPQGSESREGAKTKLLEIKNYKEMTVLDKAVQHARMPKMPMMPKMPNMPMMPMTPNMPMAPNMTMMTMAPNMPMMPMAPNMPMMNNRIKDTAKAVEDDKNAVVKVLIKEADREILDLNDNFRKILNLAAESEDLEMLNLVAKLRGFESVASEGSDEMTALSEAFLNPHFLRTQSKDTVLHIYIQSIRTRSMMFVEKILHICALLLLETNDQGDIPLHVAARCHKFDIAKVLLEHARNQSGETDSEERVDRRMLKMKNTDGNTSFDVAVQFGNIEVVNLLIKEADTDLLDFAKNMNEILNLAAKAGDHEVLDELERHNGTQALRDAFTNFNVPGAQSKDTILHINIKSKRTRSTKFVEKILLICPLLLLEANDDDDTPLHVAVRCRKSDITKVLLEHAKNLRGEANGEERVDRRMLKMKNTDGNTTFDVAVQPGNIDVVKLLLGEADTDLLDFAKNMNKILNLTAKSGDYEMLVELERHNQTAALREAFMNFNIPGMQSKSTILHVNIKSFTSSTEFIEKIIVICPSLLLEVDEKSDTLLHVAARCGESDIVEVLLKHARNQTEEQDKGERADKKMLKMKNSDKKTALDIAIENEENEVVKTLIKEANPVFSYFADNIHQILNFAAENGDHAILGEIAKGSDDKTVLRQALEGSYIQGMQSRNSFLHININSYEPSTEFVEKILDICPSLILKVGDNNNTPLHVAAKCGEYAIVEVLLKRAKVEKLDSGETADRKMLELENSDGKTILDIAVENDEIEVVKTLIEEANPHFLDFRKILYFAAKRGDDEMVDAVAKSPNGMTIMNADITVTKSKDTIMHVHIKSSKPSTKFVERVLNTCPSLLLQVNDKDDTPLHVAAKYGHSDIAQVLLKYARGESDQDVECGGRDNWQIVRMTSKVGKKADCQMLRMKNKEGNTALHEAVRHGKTELVKILTKEKDLDFLSFANKANETPLYLAAAKGYYSMVSTILGRCSSAAHQGPSGMTALHAAVMNFTMPAHKGLNLSARQGPGGMTAVQPTVMNSNPIGPKSTTYQGPSGMTGFPPTVTNPNIPGSTLVTHQGPYGITASHPTVVNSNIQGPVSAAHGMSTTLRPDLMSSNITGPSGIMTLHPTAMNSNFPGDTSLQIMRQILAKKENLTKAQDVYGWTPLHYAAYYGLSNKVSLLLEFDKSAAYIVDKDREMTALHMAASQGHKDIIEKIISECVECSEMEDNRGWNVLHFAMLSLSKEHLVQLLTNPLVGSLIDKKDHSGNTPLHIRAATYGDSFLHVGNRQVPNDQNVSVEHILKYGLYELEEQIQLLLEDVGSGQYSNGVIRDYRRKGDDCFKIRSERRKKYYDGLKKIRESHLLVATLIATVTFTAAFTIPGGYNENQNDSNQGTAILNRDSAFRTFIITDTIAMTLSLSAVFVHIIMSFDKFQRHERLLTLALWLTIFAMGTVVVAFVTGIYAVLEPSLWLAVTTCSLGLSFFLVIVCALILISGKLFQHQGGSTEVLPTDSRKKN